jgi:hypothetical protein
MIDLCNHAALDKLKMRQDRRPNSGLWLKHIASDT